MLFTSSTDVYLSLNGEVIPNHGYVEIGNIGSSNTDALLCHTVGSSSGGGWFAPDGTKVGGIGSTDVAGFERNRGPLVVRLRKTSGTSDEGIYRCTVRNAADTFQSVYVGLYNMGDMGGGCTYNGTVFSNNSTCSFPQELSHCLVV